LYWRFIASMTSVGGWRPSGFSSGLPGTAHASVSVIV
jgi:hypothetical protein